MWVAAVGDGLIIAAKLPQTLARHIAPLAWAGGPGVTSLTFRDFLYYGELLVNWANS